MDPDNVDRQTLAARVVARIAACALFLTGGDAVALFDDRLEVVVGQSATHDDNVFRLARGVDPVTALGTSDRSDTYHATSLGLKFDVPQASHRYRGDLGVDRYQFERFSNLELEGHHGSFDWTFSGVDALTSRLGYLESRTLASLSNIQGGAQSTAPNFIDYRRTYAEASYEITPRWAFRAELGRGAQENSASLYTLSDMSVKTQDLELVYATPAGTRIGLDTRFVAASLPNRQLVGLQAIDNSYDERHSSVFIEWQTSRHSRLDARFGRVHRGYEDLAARNHTGSTYSVAYSWQPVDALTLTAIGQRGISTTEEVNVGHVLMETVGLRSHWRHADRVELTLDLERGDRVYRGDPVFALGLVPQRSERVSVKAVGALLHLTPIVTLDFRWRNERRSANAAAGNYRVNVAGIGVRCSF
ncbi:MAG TPA: outer membrane beta-barrel protein [Gammaproteobacteria bacterium]|nr:outer membrane beta-barrel protein [Gammaproteobacteria bacterium]